jgi:hypothetical protein
VPNAFIGSENSGRISRRGSSTSEKKRLRGITLRDIAAELLLRARSQYLEGRERPGKVEQSIHQRGESWSERDLTRNGKLEFMRPSAENIKTKFNPKNWERTFESTNPGAENIHTKFNSNDWDFMFEAGGDYFKPEQKKQNASMPIAGADLSSFFADSPEIDDD